MFGPGPEDENVADIRIICTVSHNGELRVNIHASLFSSYYIVNPVRDIGQQSVNGPDVSSEVHVEIQRDTRV